MIDDDITRSLTDDETKFLPSVDQIVCQFITGHTKYWSKLDSFRRENSNYEVNNFLHVVYKNNGRKGNDYWKLYCCITRQKNLEYEVSI